MKSIFAATGATVLLALGACQPEAEVEATTPRLGTSTVAQLNGAPVHESIYRSYAIGRSGGQLPEELSAERREELMDELLRIYVLAAEAEKHGLVDERTIAAQLRLQELRLLAQSMADRHSEKNPATELELRSEYEKAPKYEFKARHILLNTEDEAKAVIAELDGGADFAALAKEKSTGPSGPEGGDLGWFTPDRMVKPFADAILSTEVGSYGDRPTRTRFGWHVILSEERRELPLDNVREELSGAIQQQKIETYVASLLDGATIEKTPE